MSIFDTWIEKLSYQLSERIAGRLADVRTTVNYRYGNQRQQLKTKPGQPDDNMTVNFTGLIVDRGISAVIGDGIKFDLPGEGDTPEDAYIEAVWKANRKERLILSALMAAADGGTGYIRIIPDGIVGEDGNTYPRLVVLNPGFIVMDALPEDKDMVWRYLIEYQVEGLDNKTLTRRETIQITENGWEIVSEEMHGYGGRWIEVARDMWGYDFPPIVHWQNLPNPYDAAGEPDLTDDVIAVQDRMNYLASNLNKIIRYYGHPMRYGVGLGATDKLRVGPDEMVSVSKDGDIRQLEQLGDLAGSMQFLIFVRQALFDITRTVDIDSLQDKIGALTNFGLRILYSDFIAKTNTKRLLFGEALREINRRVLTMNGMNPDPGDVVWSDILPTNVQEEINVLTSDLGNGLVSKQTASKRRGYDWESEQERMQEEAAAGDNVGAAVLRLFNQGGQ